MKPAAPPVLALASFPPPPARTPYYCERLVTEAQRLLSHSPMGVAQVAYELGFDDASYFVRYFRKYIGTTPEAFRQQH